MQIRAVLEMFGNINALLGKEVAFFMQSGKGSCDRDAKALQFEGGFEVLQGLAGPKRPKKLTETTFGPVPFDDYF